MHNALTAPSDKLMIGGQIELNNPPIRTMSRATANDPDRHVTHAAASPTAWGSEAVADLLRALGIEFIALTPGASFRGLHDSLVNHLGNTRPDMLLCLHEETAVALAHGWAR